ncbi:MAG: tRNA (adenosine(37)-N6)-dimethylallyltransferase MiaA, partial [Sphingobacteriales bacterium]
PFSHFRTGNKANRNFESIKIGLERNREELYDRINRRVEEMLQQGLLEEVKALFPYRHLNALNTVGYSEFFDFLEGKTDFEEAVRLVKRNSRRYAKRQLTWFRKDKDFTWFDAGNFLEILSFATSATAQKSS